MYMILVIIKLFLVKVALCKTAIIWFQTYFTTHIKVFKSLILSSLSSLGKSISKRKVVNNNRHLQLLVSVLIVFYQLMNFNSLIDETNSFL